MIHRYFVSGAQGTQEGQLTLSGVSDIGQFWIQGNVLIGPDVVNAAVYFWKYPRGRRHNQRRESWRIAATTITQEARASIDEVI